MKTLFIFLFLVYGQQMNACDPDTSRIVSFFTKYNSLCHADNGEMWGISLLGPLLIIDKEHKIIYSNTQDRYHHFNKTGSFYTGTLPDTLGFGSTSTHWLDIHWAQTMWETLMESTETEQLEVLMHESFHRIQEDLGLNKSYGNMPHLTTLDGRFLLFMEHRALAHALTTSGDEKNKAIRDALSFRYSRHSLFPENVESEKALEILEGTANFTGKILAGYSRDSLLQQIDENLETMLQATSLTRMYAYYAGLLYGLLLDDHCSEWRKDFILSPDFGKALQQCYSVETLAKTKQIQSKYDGKNLYKKEKKREKINNRTNSKYKQLFFNKKSYAISLTGMKNIHFNGTDTMLPVDTVGTVYNHLRIIAKWGILELDGVGLVDSSWSTIYLPPGKITQNLGEVIGETWRIILNEGWDFGKIHKTLNPQLIFRKGNKAL
jgi:hypothetical protein